MEMFESYWLVGDEEDPDSYTIMDGHRWTEEDLREFMEQEGYTWMIEIPNTRVYIKPRKEVKNGFF